MKITAYVSHSDCSRHDTGWGHPEHQGRLPAVARAVYRDMLTLFEPLLEVEGQPATEADVQLAHSPGYVEQVRAAAAEAGRSGSPLPFGRDGMISGPSWEAALAAVGCALTAVDLVLRGEVRNAFCPIRPPGHEVGIDGPGRYGLFNAAAVAARHLRERHAVARVLVLDVGAAQGRGTAEIVAADPGIRFVSVHQAVGGDDERGPRSGQFMALPAGTPGDAFQAAVAAALDAAISDFPPDFILLSLGFDALAADPLAGLALEPIDYFGMTASIRERADALSGGRLVSLLEGGYDPSATAAAVVQHLRALAGLPPA